VLWVYRLSSDWYFEVPQSLEICLAHSRHIVHIWWMDGWMNREQQVVTKKESNQVLITHTCNPSYSWGRDQEDHSAKSTRAYSSWDPTLEKTHHKKKASGVAHMVVLQKGPDRDWGHQSFREASFLGRPAVTWWTWVQRLSPKNKAGLPYIPFRAGYRNGVQLVPYIITCNFIGCFNLLGEVTRLWSPGNFPNFGFFCWFVSL
jgi:predicted lipoprotein with Yx(FWY)xxD motif